MGEANEVIKEVHSLMCDVKVEVPKEYDDIVMAAHSDLGWNTVKQFRGGFGIPDGSQRAAVRARGGRGWEYLPFSSRESGAAGTGGSVSDGGAIERREACNWQSNARANCA